MASQAVAKAEQGRLEEATKLAKEAMTELEQIESGAKTIAEAKAEVRKLFIS
jgi:hypothetical protein